MTYMQTGGDVRPQYFGHGGQVQSAKAGTRYQLHHGNHAVQLRLVHGQRGEGGQIRLHDRKMCGETGTF